MHSLDPPLESNRRKTSDVRQNGYIFSLKHCTIFAIQCIEICKHIDRVKSPHHFFIASLFGMHSFTLGGK